MWPVYNYLMCLFYKVSNTRKDLSDAQAHYNGNQYGDVFKGTQAVLLIMEYYFSILNKLILYMSYR